MLLFPEKTPVRDLYRTLIDVVTPRPIAWVTTIDDLGRVNLAPFSFFNVFGTNPPVVAFSPTVKRDSSKKDTHLNIEANGEFVINAAVESLSNEVNITGLELPHGESEVELAGLTLVDSVRVKPPRVAESPVHLECRLNRVITIGEGPGQANLVIGEVVAIHVADSVLDASGQIDPHKLKTIARMGGDFYCRTSDLFALKRPGT